jgi:hypothetical protein
MKTILTFLLVFLLASVTSAQSRIQFVKKTESSATRENTYSVKRKVKLMTPQGKWTRWNYCDNLYGNVLVCGDTSYLLDSFILIRVKRPSTFSRIWPFMPFLASASGTLLYARREGINEGIVAPFVLSVASFPLSIYGVVHLFKKRPVYDLREWNMIVK